MRLHCITRSNLLQIENYSKCSYLRTITAVKVFTCFQFKLSCVWRVARGAYVFMCKLLSLKSKDI